VTRSPWISAASQRTLVPTPVTTPAGTFEVPYRMRFLHPRESLALGLIEHQGKDSSLVLIKLVTECQGQGFGHPGTFKPGRPTAAISSPIIRGDFAGVAICSGAFLLVRRACLAEKPMPVPSPPARGKGSEEQGRRARMSWRYGRGGGRAGDRSPMLIDVIFLSRDLAAASSYSRSGGVTLAIHRS
jgi:hypothetical protein